MTHDVRVAVAYLWLLLPICALAIVASLATILALNALPMRDGPLWLGIAVNVVPAAAVGFFCYRWAARYWRGRTSGVSRHWVRTVPLYVLATVLWTLIAASWREPGFGLLAQLVVWPGLAMLAGILGDWTGWRRAASAVAAV